MAVSTFITPDPSTQAVDQYLSVLDGDIAVLARLGAAFAPHQSEPASLRIVVDAGAMLNAGALFEIGSQTTSAITPPSSNARIDRIVIDRVAGVATVITGTESTTPVPPQMPMGSIPVARIMLFPGVTTITNSTIFDERVSSSAGNSTGLINVRRFTGNAVYTPTSGTTSVVVEVLGGGGGGGGCATTSASQMSAGGGGGAGSYGRSRFTAGFAGVSITVATGVPAAGTGAPGTPGNASSFGNLLVAPGGLGGQSGAAVSSASITWGSNVTQPPTGVNIAGGSGEGGGKGFALSPSSATGGNGGASLYGSGSGGSLNGNSGSGNASASSGAGGGGACNIASMDARAGGAGSGGLVVVYEYA